MCSACDLIRPAAPSRRALFTGAIAAMALRHTALAASEAPADGVPGDKALHLLMEGNARYIANHPKERNFNSGRVERLTKQKPFAAILSCADSRVAPEFIFDEGPGKLFVVRVAGNVLDPYGLASLEYAVRFLGTRLVFVLGHRNCGAVDAAIKAVKDNAALPGHLPELIDGIKPAVLAAEQTKPHDLLVAATKENVRQTQTRIAQAEPILSAASSSGQLKIAGGVYDLANGRVDLL